MLKTNELLLKVRHLVESGAPQDAVLKELKTLHDYIFRDMKSYYETPPMSHKEHDSVNHPMHYNQHPSGIECIEIVRHYTFSIGNAIKYLWRAGLKKDASLTDKQKEIEDLEKAKWYIDDYIKQLKNGAEQQDN